MIEGTTSKEDMRDALHLRLHAGENRGLQELHAIDIIEMHEILWGSCEVRSRRLREEHRTNVQQRNQGLFLGSCYHHLFVFITNSLLDDNPSHIM